MAIPPFARPAPRSRPTLYRKLKEYGIADPLRDD
jgi:transcriptional regulator of acetoin/glycerol metabolism